MFYHRAVPCHRLAVKRFELSEVPLTQIKLTISSSPQSSLTFFFLSNSLQFFSTDRLHLISAQKRKRKRTTTTTTTGIHLSRAPVLKTVTRRRSVFVQPVFFTDGGIYFQIRTSPPTPSRRHLRENSAPAVQTTGG